MKQNRLSQILVLGALLSAGGCALTGCATSKTTTPAPKSTQQATSKETTETAESRRKQITDIAASSYNGVALVKTTTDKPGFGTAVFITPDTLLTNRHVVVPFKNADEAAVQVMGTDGKPIDLPVKELIAPEDDSMDVGIIKLKTPITENKALNHIKIQKIASLETVNKTKVADFVRAVGYPGDKERGTLWDSHGTIKEIDGNFLTYDALIASGSSGSPLFNKDGELIGIANASTDDTENPTSFGLLFDKTIRAFIAKHQ
ncbi:hypothetical protein BU202_01060 [Streptococcus cuniculi]|uniref:Serine protease n=1 Tax=Streptococcus cuniculi TaxID=1432788 RepID=A0A1Q8EAU2_9STRE|nr:trypsin-like peptidase domain-containing protein [Streptococcus cuniculi]OLF48904.1 hypothetical protein BU202_01060 [Streptococcus cuniculi]